MIERITIENFKSFRKADLKLSRLNLFIGTNASGKSNFFDALRLVSGLARGISVKELLEGGTKTATGEKWPGIRGGVANAIFKAKGGSANGNPVQASVSIEMMMDSSKVDYEFAFDGDGKTTREVLRKDGKDVFTFDGQNGCFYHEKGPPSAIYPDLISSQLVLSLRVGLAGEHRMFVEKVMEQLIGFQFFDPKYEILRLYGSAAEITHMGEHGENFPSLVRHICNDARKKEAYLSWLRELRPSEVDDVTTLSGAIGEPLFALREGGREFPAMVLSDGTLRFAAITAALFQQPMPKVIALEEIENGIHAGRLRLLIELLRSQSEQGGTQVFATTHSPTILEWLKPEEYHTTFIFRRDEATAESLISPLSEIPHFTEVVKRQPLSDLFAEGWLEAAL